ncbi:MAG: hypothetical protein HY919_02825 [Elusimicrobia bacterium]|nr:hypothetical protein [Elusimicrobiota bacterium]
MSDICFYYETVEKPVLSLRGLIYRPVAISFIVGNNFMGLLYFVRNDGKRYFFNNIIISKNNGMSRSENEKQKNMGDEMLIV